MAIPVVMPKLGMVMSEGTVARYAKAPGEAVTQGEIIAEIETEKLNYDLEATGSGRFHPVVPEGTVVPVDGLLGYLLAEGEAVPEPETREATGAPPAPATPVKRDAPPPRAPGAQVRSTPGARRLAAKLGVDTAEVSPTGPGGRVVEDDVRVYAERKTAVPEQALPPGSPQPSKTVPLEGIRKSIAQHMRGSIAGTAQLSFFVDIDVTEAQLQRREASDSSDASITMGDVLIKACAETLKRHPEHNTVLSDGKVLYFDEVNIGMAVALSEGLIVPVVKQADKKSIFEISRETHELAARAKEGKLLPDDVSGGTFTISVLGSVDGFTPILNAGQSAILGVGRSLQKPVVKGGEVVVREMMTVSLTVDHQVIDGALAASFLRRLQQIVGRPGDLFK
jgi:pyruvate dehydrogenase E2 component (dihydrolipoamide acetyltransferase)